MDPGTGWKTLASLCSQMLNDFKMRKIMGTFVALLKSPTPNIISHLISRKKSGEK